MYPQRKRPESLKDESCFDWIQYANYLEELNRIAEHQNNEANALYLKVAEVVNEYHPDKNHRDSEWDVLPGGVAHVIRHYKDRAEKAEAALESARKGVWDFLALGIRAKIENLGAPGSTMVEKKGSLNVSESGDLELEEVTPIPPIDPNDIPDPKTGYTYREYVAMKMAGELD